MRMRNIAFGLSIGLAVVLLSSCNQATEPVFQGWVEAELIFVGPDENGRIETLTVREGSPVEKGMLLLTLDGDLQNSIFIPPGCAHGFQVLTETADTSYRITRAHEPSEDLTIAHDDPELAIPWPLDVTLMSEGDRRAPTLADLADRLSTVSATV